MVDGYDRSFILYLPLGYNNAGKMPLVFVIHGGSGTPEGMIRIADFRAIADKEKIGLVYPAGIEKNWNDGRPTTPNQMGVNDVGFFNRVCDYMIANHPVDAARIYATGISNGGFMSSRLGCELGNRIAAIAVVAATMEALAISPACNPPPTGARHVHPRHHRPPGAVHGRGDDSGWHGRRHHPLACPGGGQMGRTQPL